MSDRHDDRSDLSPETEAFVESLREGYAPEAPTPARAQAFDAELRERLEQPQRESWLRPALVTATIGALIGWLLMPPAPDPTPAEQAPPRIASEAQLQETVADWEAELLSASEIEEFGAGSDDSFLPDEYQAIAGVFLDG